MTFDEYVETEEYQKVKDITFRFVNFYKNIAIFVGEEFSGETHKLRVEIEYRDEFGVTCTVGEWQGADFMIDALEIE